MTTDKRPAGFVPLGVFFFFAATMATYAAVTLLFPGTSLDHLWALNRTGHAQLARFGKIMALPFAILALIALVSGMGWFKRRRWAWVVGVSGIAFNLAGDLINMIIGEFWKGAAGVGIAALLLTYMTRRSVRDYFRPG
jgi:hypothetical protein